LCSHSNQKHPAFQTTKAQIVQGIQINLSQIFVLYFPFRLTDIPETSSQELAIKSFFSSSYSHHFKLFTITIQEYSSKAKSKLVHFQINKIGRLFSLAK
jgi:hypothetical protein